MNSLKTGIENIKEQLSHISKEMEIINEDNFSETITNVNSLIRGIEGEKQKIKKKSTKIEYKSVCDLLHSSIKQISSEFDSVIERKKEEQNKISSELSKLLNKKKLINYQR